MFQAEDMSRKLSVRTKEMARAQDRAEAAHNKLEKVTEQLRKADIKVRLVLDAVPDISILSLLQMASLQFNLEDRSRMDNKYKKQIVNIQAKIANADQRFARDEGFLLKLKERMQHIDDRRKMKEEEKNKKKK